MGTRADFYIGRGEGAEWIGSIAFDGYPSGIEKTVLAATDEATFRSEIFAMFADRDDATRPDMGWPWPWDTSSTTDYAYAIEDGTVWASCFGSPWYAPDDDAEPPNGKSAVFPNMAERRNFTLGKRSGLMVFTG